MKNFKNTNKTGYGLAMLMVFLATTVMIGASMQMMAAPITMAYLGASSQDNLAARQLAEAGMDVVQADLQAKFDNGVNITTGYSYPLTPMSMPNSPDALAGATSVVGSYSGSAAAVNGNTVLAKVTATVGVGTYTFSKLIILSRNFYPLDNVSGASVAYGMRLLRSAHLSSGSPYAIRVRRASDNTEQDIGFTSTGGLDTLALRTFLEGTAYQKPLDAVSGAANAYGLRKLRAAYTGAAVRIRRSIDNAEQDIGFTSSGALDLNSLIDFVGTSSGYVTTWYDQSGNGANATQGTAADQPALVSAGVLHMVDGHPAIRFDGSNDSLLFTRSIGDDFSILASYSAISGTGVAGGNWHEHAGLVDMEVAGVVNDAGISIDQDGNVYGGVGSPDNTVNIASPGQSDGKTHRLTFTRNKTTGQFTLYVDGVAAPGSNGNLNTLSACPQIRIGRIYSNGFPFNGYVSEVMTYGSLLSNANRQTLERNQASYFNVNTQSPSFTHDTDMPLDHVGGPAAAYSLRKLTSGYSGSAIRVRRSNDNAVQDIGFTTAGDLDTGALLTFVANNSAYVTTWYDQSGNSRHATNATAAAQPRIVNAGVIDTLNGKPTIRGLGAQILYGPDAAIIGGGGGWHYFMVLADYGSADTTSFIDRNCLTDGCVSGAGGSGAPLASLRKTGGVARLEKRLDDYSGYAYVSANTVIPTDGTPMLIDYGRNRGVSYNIYLNGTLMSTVGDAEGNMSPRGPAILGHATNVTKTNASISELIIYAYTPTASQQTYIRQNELQYHSQPLAQGFVTTWYDQSGNGKNLTQTNYENQPRIILHPQPSLGFNGSNKYMENTAMSFTGTTATALAVAKLSQHGTSYAAPRILSGWANGQTQDSNNISSAAFFYKNGSNMQLLGMRNNISGGGTLSGYEQMFQARIVFDGSFANQAINGVSGGGFTSTGSFNLQNIRIGGSLQGTFYDFWKGNISEVILYPTALNSYQLQSVEQGQRNFYGTP